MVKKKAGNKMNQLDQAFDVSKVEAKLKNIKSLSDLTGSSGIVQEMIKQTVERILKAEQEKPRI